MIYNWMISQGIPPSTLIDEPDSTGASPIMRPGLPADLVRFFIEKGKARLDRHDKEGSVPFEYWLVLENADQGHWLAETIMYLKHLFFPPPLEVATMAEWRRSLSRLPFILSLSKEYT